MGRARSSGTAYSNCRMGVRLWVTVTVVPCGLLCAMLYRCAFLRRELLSALHIKRAGMGRARSSGTAYSNCRMGHCDRRALWLAVCNVVPMRIFAKGIAECITYKEGWYRWARSSGIAYSNCRMGVRLWVTVTVVPCGLLYAMLYRCAFLRRELPSASYIKRAGIGGPDPQV